jgi:hypothetical protein
MKWPQAPDLPVDCHEDQGPAMLSHWRFVADIPCVVVPEETHKY